MVAPATRPYRIIFFISTTPDKILVFPMSTAEILKYQCSINVLDYNDGVPVYRQITYNDYGSNSQGLMGLYGLYWKKQIKNITWYIPYIPGPHC